MGRIKTRLVFCEDMMMVGAGKPTTKKRHLGWRLNIES